MDWTEGVEVRSLVDAVRIPDRLEGLIHEGIITDVVRPLMSGKEAQIFLVRSGEDFGVAKIYKEASHRSFKHRSQYTEGRGVRRSRDARAMQKGSRYGRAKSEEAWKSAEVDAIYRLREAGVRVPQPYHFFEGVLVMELVTDADGDPAHRLGDVELDPEMAMLFFEILLREVVRMTVAGVVHGDLSEFNILVGADGPVIIDFPQAVDPASNPNARGLLIRDVNNLVGFISRYFPEFRNRRYGEEIWAAYERAELTSETELTGRWRPERGQVVDTNAVLQELRDVESEAQRNNQYRGSKRKPQRGDDRKAASSDQVQRAPHPEGRTEYKPSRSTARGHAENTTARERGEQRTARERGENSIARGRAENSIARGHAEQRTARGRAENATARERGEQRTARGRAENGTARERGEQRTARGRAENGTARGRAENATARRAENATARERGEQRTARGRAENATARGRAENATARGRAENATARGRAENATARGRAENSTAREHGEQRTARGRAENSTAREHGEQRTARGRAENSTARGRAENSTARGRAENSTARGRAEQRTARGRAENSTARGRAEQRTARGRAQGQDDQRGPPSNNRSSQPRHEGRRAPDSKPSSSSDRARGGHSRSSSPRRRRSDSRTEH